MKKVILWILTLSLVAAIAVGATLAYHTSTSEDVNVMTVGEVRIDQLEFERVDDETAGEDAVIQEFHNDKPLYPAVVDPSRDWPEEDALVHWDQIGKDDYTTDIWNPDQINNEIDKMIFVKNKGSFDAYVRSVFAFEVNGYSYEEFKENFRLNINEEDWIWTWVEVPVEIGSTNYIIAEAVYKYPLAPGEITTISLEQVALIPEADHEDILGFGDTYQILVNSQAVQTDGFTDPSEALDNAFYPIDASRYPFEDDNPTLGTDLRTALHYLDGDGVTWIADDIDLVVFGNVADYQDIALSNDGTLVDAEQEVEVKSYYVKDENDRYVVYFLASDTIYTPKDSSNLFANMNYLTTVVTENMSVSKTENMSGMFTSCHSLTDMDVSHWDTSNVTDMSHMFSFCTYLNTLDLTTWDVSNVTNMNSMFFMDPTDYFGAKSKLHDLNVSNWDVSNVTDMAHMFRGCSELTALDVSHWDTGNLTTMQRMFSDCMKLSYLPIEGWDVSNVTSLLDTFVNCTALPSMDLSGWDVSKVTDLQGTFTSCLSMETLNVTGWNTSAVNNMHQTFWNCRGLKEVIGISDWDVSNVTKMRGVFAYCGLNSKDFRVDLGKWDVSNVTRLDLFFYMGEFIHPTGLENWDVSNVTTFQYMFYDCEQVTELDLSRWNTSKVTNTYRMFGYCYNLKTIYVGESWDMSNVTSSGQMFRSCNALTGANGTKISGNPQDKTYARVDIPAVVDEEGNVITEAVPGYLTYKEALTEQ